VNGTVLRYYFFDEEPEPGWVGGSEQQDVVRRSFQQWKDLGIGLDFEEVSDRRDAEVRIGFLPGDGSWSYIGREVLQAGADERTMNFGWSLTQDDYGLTTALHEIGHTLGLPHEHQNPFAGIVWNEEAVYAEFAGGPNFWPPQDTYSNVLERLNPRAVEGSRWDPDSIMEYEFGAGLIVAPEAYRDGVFPPGTISEVDREWVRKWYPGGPPAPRETEPFRSIPLPLKPAEQAEFSISPPESREYTMATFGTADTVIVLFEEVEGQLRYVAGADDSGANENASLSVKLFQGRRYVLRVRLQWVGGSGTTAVMYW